MGARISNSEVLLSTIKSLSSARINGDKNILQRQGKVKENPATAEADGCLGFEGIRPTPESILAVTVYFR